MSLNAQQVKEIRARVWLVTALLTLLPLVAIKVADPFAWKVEDLPFAFVFISAVGLAMEFALRVPERLAGKAGAVVAAGTGLLLVWGNLAVGFAGSEDNRINLIFFLIPAIVLVGAIAVRGRAAGMVWVLAFTAVAQLIAGVAAGIAGYFTGPLTIAFSGLWLAAALMFRRSGTRQSLPG